MKCRQSITAVLLIIAAVGPCLGQGQVAAEPLTPAEQIELRTLSNQLSDPARAPRTKQDAAEILLTRQYQAATDALCAFLGDPLNRPAQVAIAEAISQNGGGHARFVKPLMDMLNGDEPSVRSPAARALATYRDQDVVAQLVGVAAGQGDRAVRLVVIEALGRVMEKQAVDALVALLDDGDGQIRTAAGEALARLTSIRHFGADPARWKQWWDDNKDKPRTRWLADLAESLSRSQAAMEADNQRLRERLAGSLRDLYTALPPGQKEALLLSLLRDALADVRLVGLQLTMRRLDVAEEISADLRSQVRSLLGDVDASAREAAAVLTGMLNDASAGPVLLSRLNVETSPAVRVAVLTALGRLRDASAMPALVQELQDTQYDRAAAAAATAIVRVSDRQGLSPEHRETVVASVYERYVRARTVGNGTALRESLLNVMGALPDASFAPLMEDALGDPAATVRLAAVQALAKHRNGPSVADRLARVIDDPDRGVRQAVIASLGSVGGLNSLHLILQRTTPAVERDPAVQQQAWEVAMALLARSDAATLAGAADALADRPDAHGQRVRIIQMLVDNLRASNSPQLPMALHQLGRLLLAGKPAEAAVLLSEAYAGMARAGNPAAAAVWSDWLEALLAAEDPALVGVLSRQESAGEFAAGFDRLCEHVAKLLRAGRHRQALTVAQEGQRLLAARLNDQQRQKLDALAEDAQQHVLQGNRHVVRRLLQQAAGGEDQAAASLVEMGDRAATCLLEELVIALEVEPPDGEIEQAAVSALREILPAAASYDAAAPKAQRLELARRLLAARAGADP